MNNVKRVSVFFLGLMVWLGTYSVQAQDPVRVGIFDFPPFYSKRVEEPAKGLLVDLAKNEIAEINRISEFNIMSTPTLIKSLVNGDVDVGMLIKHPALLDTALYSKKPISNIELVAFRGMNTPKLKSYNNLSGQKVLVLAGYGYGGILAKMKKLDIKPIFVEASDIESGLDMLLSGRADYFLSYLKPSREIAKRKGYLSRDNWLVSDEISKFDVYWIVSKMIDGAEELMERLESVQ